MGMRNIEEIKKLLAEEGRRYTGRDLYDYLKKVDQVLVYPPNTGRRPELFGALKSYFIQMNKMGLLKDCLDNSFLMAGNVVLIFCPKKICELVFMIQEHIEASEEIKDFCVAILAIAVWAQDPLAMTQFKKYDVPQLKSILEARESFENSGILEVPTEQWVCHYVPVCYKYLYENINRLYKGLTGHYSEHEIYCALYQCDLKCEVDQLSIVEEKHKKLQEICKSFVMPELFKACVVKAYQHLKTQIENKKITQTNFLAEFIALERCTKSSACSAYSTPAQDYETFVGHKCRVYERFQQDFNSLASRITQAIALEPGNNNLTALLKRVEDENVNLTTEICNLKNDLMFFRAERDKFLGLSRKIDCKIRDYLANHNPGEHRKQLIHDIEAYILQLTNDNTCNFSIKTRKLLDFVAVKRQEATDDHYAGYSGALKWTESTFAQICDEILGESAPQQVSHSSVKCSKM
jgi:hypothetical protein